jgi:hypothetical protein
MEEHLVIDAIAIWPRKTLGGDLFSLEVLDGTTIKPLLDERGNTPAPPYPAYQQVLVGFPRGEFVADAVADGEGTVVIDNGYEKDQLIYERWNVRTFSPYGFSVVEQALIDADLWLKRQTWMRAEYSDGVMPAGFLTTDTPFTPDQLRMYNAVFNDYLAGNTKERQRVQVLPKGFAPVEGKQTDERYRPHYDEFLLKLVCSHFGVMPTALGFTPSSGLGGKGHQEGEQETGERQATRPVTEWLAELFTRISHTLLGMPDELCFKFLNLDDEDEAAADVTDDNRVKSARMTLNESRDRIGQPRYDFPEADMPMIVTPTGVTFLNGEAQRQADQQEQSKALAQAAQQQPAGAVGSGSAGPGGGKPPTGAAPAKTPEKAPEKAAPAKPGPTAVAKADEHRALVKWLSKRGASPSRPFVCTALTRDDLGVSYDAAIEDGVLIPKGDDAPREGLAGLDGARRADGPAPARHRAGFEWPAS